MDVGRRFNELKHSLYSIIGGFTLFVMSACSPMPTIYQPPPPKTTPQLLTVTNLVFHDYNGNGIKEFEEPTLSGIKLTYGPEDIELTYGPEDISCISGSDGICFFNVPSGNYRIYINDSSKKFRYILPSVSEVRSIETGLDVTIVNDVQIAIPLAEGFLTLPFKKGTTMYQSTSYKDVMPGPEIKDWMGGRKTYNGHRGTDFFIYEGNDILAPCPGIVYGIEKNNEGGGMTAWICYEKYLIGTTHLKDVVVEKRQIISRGDVIGHAGYAIGVFKKMPSQHVDLSIMIYQEPTDEYPRGLYKSIDPFESPEDTYMLWTKYNDPQYPR